MTKNVRNSILIGAAAVAAGAIGIFLNTAQGRKTTEQLAARAKDLNKNIGAYADKYAKKGSEMIDKAKKTASKQTEEVMNQMKG